MDEGFQIEAEALAQVLDELDYFQVLKIGQSASPGEIKAAYYRESRAYHPDRFSTLPAGELKDNIGRIYKRINEAYVCLRDDVKRAKYLADVNGPPFAVTAAFSTAFTVASGPPGADASRIGNPLVASPANSALTIVADRRHHRGSSTQMSAAVPTYVATYSRRRVGNASGARLMSARTEVWTWLRSIVTQLRLLDESGSLTSWGPGS